MTTHTVDITHLFNALPGCVYCKDRRGVYLSCNVYMAKMAGLDSPADVIGKTDYDLPWCEQAHLIQAVDQHVMQSGVEETCEEFGKLANGTISTYLSTKSPLKDEHGNIVGVLGFSMNIDEIKKREATETQKKIEIENQYQQAHLDNLYLKNILQNLPEPVYWMDANNTILGCNDAEARICGLQSAEELIGKSIYDMAEKWGWEKSIADTISRNNQEIISSRKSMVIEEAAQTIDGKTITYLSCKAPLYNRNKEVVGIIGIALDITARKRVEDALKEAKNSAEAASKVKGEFIANMSHDIKTPLSGIISLSEILRTTAIDTLPEDCKSIPQELVSAGQRLMTFFDNCIELSKLENDALVISEESFSLKQLLMDITQLFQPAIAAKKLSFQLNYSEKIPPRLLGSRINLYRILINLMGNAIKFTAHGSITIDAGLSQNSTSEKSVIKLTITDSGIGIPTDKQKVIFERFARLVPSYTGTYEGSGIGLYIVKTIVKTMGGEVIVKSEEGKGSQFILAIPFSASLLTEDEYEETVNFSPVFAEKTTVAPAARRTQILPTSAQQILLDSATKSKVLVVEDNLLAQRGAKSILTNLGCDVDVADTGEKAIALFEPGKYALVFMDIGLPDMQGYEVSKCFREREKKSTHHVPILGLSAHASHEEEKLSKVADMETMLSKPLMANQAKTLLDEYVFGNMPRTNKQSSASARVSASTPDNKLAVIDFNAISGNDKMSAILKSTLEDFMESLPDYCTQIDQAYQAQDMPVLSKILHKFHGGVCYAPTPELQKIVKKIDVNLKNEKYEDVDALYKEFLSAIKNLEKAYTPLIS